MWSTMMLYCWYSFLLLKHQKFLHHEPSEWQRSMMQNEVMNMPDLAMQSLALTIHHLKEFGFERIVCSGFSLRPFSRNMEMTFSANAFQQLEILKNNSDGSENGTLLQIMNRTLTIFGSRLLRHWTMISACLHAVSEIAESMKQSHYVLLLCSFKEQLPTCSCPCNESSNGLLGD
ncbi:DNA mismatch repair protein MSH3 [Arachis hypogaea]|uniref:DNA mismatch repair protein MSH3 n=2 Tax=Arachis TaxID=3817 RepID=UPI003B2150D6